MAAIRRRARQCGFVGKCAGAVGLIVLGDWLAWSEDFVGPALGLFALAWAIATLATSPALRHDRRALRVLAAALMAALVLVEDPSLLAWGLFGAALLMAVLLPRTSRFDDGWRWLQRLVMAGLTAIVGPTRDTLRLLRQRARGERRPLTRFVPLLALPLLGGAVFTALFANANPLIGDALARLELPAVEVDRLVWWAILLTLVWTTLRPRRVRPWLGSFEGGSASPLPGVSVGSVTLSLLLFNAIFAVENILDIAFLWSGAPLPADVKMKDYVHRGAYPLIATALLAALFVLVTLRPGSDTAARPLIRRLVLLWIAQNVLLVASSALRTLRYIDSYLLTELRIAALAWMALVAAGLILICWRLFADKTAAWLINTNCAAALLVLAVASVIDLGAVAAAWNVTHAREVGGRGQPLDICYLGELGPSALLPLTELAMRTPRSAFGDRVRWARQRALAATLESQSGRDWSWRNARRLTVAEPVRGLAPLAAIPGSRRACSGKLVADLVISPVGARAEPPRSATQATPPASQITPPASQITPPAPPPSPPRLTQPPQR